MHDVALLATLAGGLTAALVLGYLTQRLGLSPIVGYLLAGTAGRPVHARLRRRLASRRAARRGRRHPADVRRRPAVPPRGAARRAPRRRFPARSSRAWSPPRWALRSHTVLGWAWPAGDRLRHGACRSPAPSCWCACCRTTDDLHTPTGHIAVGWLVVEDLFTVLVAGAAAGARSAPARRCTSLGPALALTAGQGRRPGRRSRSSSAAASSRGCSIASRATRSRELFTLTVLVIALGIAVGSALSSASRWRSARSSPGMVVGRSDFSLRAASDALPMRDAFAVLFFVSVGMLLDPRALLRRAGARRRRADRRPGRQAARRACSSCWLMRYPLRVGARGRRSPSRRSASSRSSWRRSGATARAC